MIEILVVVALFAALTSLGVIIAFDSIVRSTVHNERDIVVLALAGARARALANVNEKSHGVQITSDSVIVFEGDDPASDPNKVTTGRSSSIVVSPEPAVVIFSQLTGNATTDGSTKCDPENSPLFPCSITLSDGSKNAVIDINTYGRVEW